MPFQVGSVAVHDDGQHFGTSKRDTVGGVAGLDASGHLLALAYRIYAARGGSEQVTFRERTSDERMMRLIRNGANDYEERINVGGVEKVVQHEGMKNVASGIAGLDANILLEPFVHRGGLEEYSNHLGAVDNFTEVQVAGNGVATPDVANHEMDLSTGVGAVGYAAFNSKKLWTFGVVPIVSSFLIQNLVSGAGPSRASKVGFDADFTDMALQDGAHFRQANSGAWNVETHLAGAQTTTGIDPLANGDLVSIVATSSAVMFYKNRVLLVTHDTNIPTVPVMIGAAVADTFGGVNPARTLSVDMMSIIRYM